MGASAIVICAFCIAGTVAIGSGTGIFGEVGKVGDDTSGAEVMVMRGLCCVVGDVGLVGSGTSPLPGRLE